MYHLCMDLVEVDAVSKSYARRVGMRTEQHDVVSDVSFTIAAGETLGLVGESGSGKTTVARMILGLVKPTQGSVRVDGIDISSASSAQLHALRRQMQPVFQDPSAALNPRMNVREILTEPWLIHPGACGAASVSSSETDQLTKPDANPSPTANKIKTPCPILAPFFWREGGNSTTLRARAAALLREVGLDESALNRHPHEFSGGQRQRINIARALALRPRLLILDEPVSALDVSVGAQIVNLLVSLQREHGLTYLFISHSMPLVRYICARIAVMERGRLVEMGESVALCDHPQQPYTRQLLAATPELPPPPAVGPAFS